MVVAVFEVMLAQGFASTVIYAYDSLNRLKNVNYGNGSVISYAYDAVGNRLTYSGVVAKDPTAPTISITSPTSAPSFTTRNASINLSGTASDNIGVSLITWENDRGGIGTASGTNPWNINGIPLRSGANVITVTAYDVAGNTTTATLTVEDYTPPTIDCTAAKTVECGSAWSFDTPTANAVFGEVTLSIVSTTINRAGKLGSSFDATRTWRATDASGNFAECSQTVTVVDTTLPAIACPSNISVFTANPAGTAVNFTVTAEDYCSGVLTPACIPTSGSVFPVGSTTVNCTATDANQNSSTCSFTVTVIRQ